MKKVDTKVKLKKYLSQKEKIKNTFISSCIILVVLTFFIFITYSYFINKTGEIEVGNFNSSIPDVEIINKEIVKNTNNQQAIVTIKNNSNSNIYSYNLNWKDKSSGHFGEVYYKVPSEKYSHPEGIIKPNETKKIWLVANNDINKYLVQTQAYASPWELKLDSGYEYLKPDKDEGYEDIKYSPLSETAELKNLNPSIGMLSPDFNSSTLSYELHIPISENINTIELTPEISNNGKIDNGTVTISYNANTYKYSVDKKIKLYAEDGTYIKTYTISTVIRDIKEDEDLNKIFGNGKIQGIAFLNPKGQMIFANGKNEGYEDNSTITIHVPSSKKNVTTFKNYIIEWSYVDGQNFLYDNNKSWYYFCTVDSPGLYTGRLIGNKPNFTITEDYSYYDLNGKYYTLNVHFNRYGQLTNYTKTYRIELKT